MREIRLTVNADGSTTTDYTGFLGKTCLTEAEKLRTLLASFGIQMEQTTFTPKPELDIPITERRQTEEATRLRQEER